MKWKKANFFFLKQRYVQKSMSFLAILAFFPHKKNNWHLNMLQKGYFIFIIFCYLLTYKQIVQKSFIVTEICQKDYENLCSFGNFSFFPHKKNNWLLNMLQKGYFIVIIFCYLLIPYWGHIVGTAKIYFMMC